VAWAHEPAAVPSRDPVDDLAAARHFYGDVLGCPEGRNAEHWVDFDLYGHQLVADLSATHPGRIVNPVG
jgi:extradiol dioxygenase family protein